MSNFVEVTGYGGHTPNSTQLQNKNVGSWLVLGRAGEVTYKIQETKKDKVQVVHVDKLAPYHPDFGVELTSWLRDDLLPQAKGSQTESVAGTSGADVFEVEEEVGTEPQPQNAVPDGVPVPEEVQDTVRSRRSKRVRGPPRYRRLAIHPPTLSSLCPLKFYYSATRGCRRKV